MTDRQLNNRITKLQGIEAQMKELEAQAASVSEDYISAIEDPFTRIFFRLRFFQGLSWKEVAAVAGGGRPWTAVRDTCLRYLSKHPEMSQE